MAVTLHRCLAGPLALAFLLLAGCVATTSRRPSPDAAILRQALMGEDEQLLSFESAELPPWVQAGSGSEAAITAYRALNGNRSLVWRWQRPGAMLTLQRPIAYEPDPPRLAGQPAGSVFSLWIYNEQPLDAPLRIEFGRGTSVDCWFDMKLNFVGWRTAWISFQRDMQGTPSPGMDTVRFRAPDSHAPHRLFIDRVILAGTVDLRHPSADYQVPFVRQSEASDLAAPRPKLMALRPETDHISVSPGVISSIDTIYERLDALYLDAALPPEPTVLRERYARLQIRYEGGVIRGLHVPTRVHSDIYPESMREPFLDYVDAVGFKPTTELMLGLARNWRQLPEGRTRDEVRDMFLNLCRHLLDQGWSEGSGLGTLHHFGYFSRAYYPAILLMREPLQDADLLVPMSRAAQWFSNARMVLLPPRMSDADLDYWNTQARSQLLAIMSMPDSKEKIALLERYRGYLSQTIAMNTAGNYGGIKVDGTAFHHGGFYPAYAFGAFNRLASLFSVLHGTAFRLSDEAYSNLRHALLTARLYGNPDWPIAISGRHPFSGSIENMEYAFRTLAAVGPPDASARNDRELAAAYLRLWPKSPAERARIFGDAELRAEPELAGAWALNYASLGLVWANRHLVSLKGHNRYVWNSEIYARDNRYGRYQSYGSVLIMAPGGNAASGFREEGWDWNRLPGTTSIHLPLELLESPAAGTEMLRSDQTFAGAGHLDNRLGAFAVILTQPPRERFDPTFQARKSVFSFGSYLVALGSGIRNQTTAYPTETTLFQNALLKEDAPIVLDGESLRDLPLAQVPPADAGHWLVDTIGNGYIIPAGQRLRIVRQVQTSRHNKSRAPTTGAFAVAWLEHGAAPEGAAYRYMILPGAGSQATAAFAADPPVEILAQTDAVHAVRDRSSGATAAAFFAHSSSLPAMGIRSISKPCLVIREPRQGGIRMSITDPDLNIPHNDGYFLTGAARPTTVRLVLDGAWRLAEPTRGVTVIPGERSTQVQVTCRHGRPVPFTLRP